MTCTLKVNIWQERRGAKKETKKEKKKTLNVVSDPFIVQGKQSVHGITRASTMALKHGPQRDWNKDLTCKPLLSSGEN